MLNLNAFLIFYLIFLFNVSIKKKERERFNLFNDINISFLWIAIL